MSLIDFSKLSEPATELVKAIRGAGWRLYEPTHIRRTAKAEVDAMVIRAAGELAASEFEIRGLQRLIAVEGQRQQNIESITAKAIEVLPDQAEANTGDVSPDWFSQFFDCCKDVSEDDLQNVWSGILANEFQTPGAFSLRTLHIVRMLRPNEARAFQWLCTYIWRIDGVLCPIVLKVDKQSWSSMRSLQEVGLLTTSLEQQFGLPFQEDTNPHLLVYFDKRFHLEAFGAPALLGGHAKLTASGTELAAITDSQPNYDYMKWLTNTYKSMAGVRGVREV